MSEHALAMDLHNTEGAGPSGCIEEGLLFIENTSFDLGHEPLSSQEEFMAMGLVSGQWPRLDGMRRAGKQCQI